MRTSLDGLLFCWVFFFLSFEVSNKSPFSRIVFRRCCLKLASGVAVAFTSDGGSLQTIVRVICPLGHRCCCFPGRGSDQVRGVHEALTFNRNVSSNHKSVGNRGVSVLGHTDLDLWFSRCESDTDRERDAWLTPAVSE